MRVLTLSVDEQCARARAESSQEAWQEVFERLIRQYGASIERTCRGYERDPELRQELLQEIWLGLWRGLPRFQGKSSLRTWTYRVVHNLAVSHVAKHAKRVEQTELDLDELATELSTVEQDLDRHRARQMLAGLIRQLRAQDRQLMLLYLEGMSHSEIAEIMGLSPSNVTTRTSRIRAALSRKVDR